MRTHYDFVRPNMALGGLTPAQVAGIDLNLSNNKVEALMRQAAIHHKELQKEPSVVKGLGIREHKIQIKRGLYRDKTSRLAGQKDGSKSMTYCGCRALAG